ncbi:hypothetical protein JCM17823_08450 [Halorubrum gandharaense]
MADVSVPVPAPFGDGDDADDVESRAQLILITGLTLAVLFVAVVLLLNTVIYTENLATRGIDAGGGEAVEFREGTVEEVSAIMHREHRNEDGPDGVAADFERSVGAYADAVRDHRMGDGVVVDVDATVTEEGHFIAQDEVDDDYRELVAHENATADEDWTLASNATRTRNFQLTVDSDSLSDESDAFSVVADGSIVGPGSVWEMSLSEASGDAVNVTVNRDGDERTRTFDQPADEDLHVDVTGGTVNGESWDPLVWAEGVEDGSADYDLEYENGDNADGTYHLVVDQRDEPSPTEADPFDDEYSDRSSQPYVVDAVYSADVDVHHRTPELEYRDTVEVAPGERDD